MIKKCMTDLDVNKAIEYIGQEMLTTPYLYVDMIKYGKGTENVTSWLDLDDDKIRGIYLLYFDCLHFYTKDIMNYDLNEIIKMHNQHNPKTLMVQGTIGDRLEPFFGDDYSIEKNYVLDMSSVGNEEREYKGCIADREDIEPIVDLLMTDDIYKVVFSKEILLSQMIERFDDAFSRYIVIKDGDKVIATCSTYGEVSNIALIGSVIVHPDYRRRGLAAEVEGYTCKMMRNEGRINIGFVNFENIPSLSLHEKIGCVRVGTLYKYLKK